ncbi:putative type II secretion system protein E [Thalassoglobus neptunius]|uniref:Putative type II secretion system protein E n=1 Tax=Thalassoglobus neptunius TaxID=1938619 RepID=A0A5C5WY35_9PLAN|nr:GspE/PulE family protein [Thalassoglobus neptunius]TWT55587.1 putative type II secretion system protein E [Thalassoglobus neptunius]
MNNESSNASPGAEEPNAMMQEIAPEARQKALQEELKGLISLVGVEPLVDLLLERAFQLGATDIHLDPRPNGMNLRLRLDGVMHDILHLDPEYAPQLVSRIKLIAGMNIAEKRIAQDGHFSNMMMEQNRDVRVGSGPTIYGERIVMRLMSDGSRFTSLEQLGLSDKQISAIEQATARPHGMILSVGPVGCGKSTTTYSCLASLNEATRSLVTIEDPVERRIPGVNQIQVDNRAHFGFVEALRGVLRQDPDVIMVGEIRDQETAHIAVRAGLMGSKVLSTLHASDTGATLDMFREFQITRMFLADAISCIIAQRLIRRVCEKNRETYTPDEVTCELLSIDPAEAEQHKLVRGIPADSNFHTGYFGRTGIFEVLAMNPSLRNYVVSGKPGRTVFEAAQEQGMETLEQSARDKVLAGITTPEEMMRVLM